jgi:vitamin B12 transporter
MTLRKVLLLTALALLAPAEVGMAQTANPTTSQVAQGEADLEEEIVVEGETPKQSTPVYSVTSDEMQNQGSDTLSETLQRSPGFAVNDAGFGADIHTGTSYRGHSINQSVFLINGRPFGSNVSTYHGGTDLNSIPLGAIDRVDLSSGSSATLYGSEAFGGVVNLITKQGDGPLRFTGSASVGSYETRNYQAGFGGATGALRYRFNYEHFQAENDYKVPVGAANRSPDGRLFNGDSKLDSFYGNLGVNLNPRNELSLDVSTTSSRRGLLYFGFPLQRDRLDHDALNLGLSWKSQLGQSNDSTLRTTLGYSRDYFSTYGPTGSFYRTGQMDSQALTGRIEHDWKLAANQRLQWGVDLKKSLLDGTADSTLPSRARLNEDENRDRFQTAFFGLHTWNITPAIQTELGLRFNNDSEFGSSLNPSLGARWQATPAIALRGSWVKVQRNPGLDQLYLYDTVHGWLPNADLDPEKGDSWTLGTDLALAKDVTAQITYFGSRLDDRIAVQSGRWANIGLVNTHGLEAAIKWQIDPKWSTFLNYTYTSAEIQEGVEKGLQLSMIPYSVGSFGVGYQSNGWLANLYGNYYSGSRRAFFFLPGESSTEFTPSWVSLDLSLKAPITKQIGLTMFLENLGGQRYEKANRIYHPGLTYRVGLQASF